MTAVMKLTPEAKTALRRCLPGMEGTQWVSELASTHGWQEANRRYLASMREQGIREMLGLMEDLGISEVVSEEDALELLETAVTVYLPEADVRRTAGDGGMLALQITVKDCPTYARIEQAGWHGVTACGSWHRRQGWYQALGVNAVDSVVGEKKWGDIACMALVQLATPADQGTVRE